MPQTLKPEAREKIIESAKTEFLERGYEDSSMRRIRFHSGMTVGNLYRYFRNKDELINLVVSPAYGAIDKLVGRLTGGKVTLSGYDSLGELNAEDLHQMMDGLSEGLADVYMGHRTELNILMMASATNKALTDWFAGAIRHIISKRYEIDADDPFCRTISRGYAVAIFEGLKEVLKISDVTGEQLKALIKIFLNTYVYMLDNDLSEYLGAHI